MQFKAWVWFIITVEAQNSHILLCWLKEMSCNVNKKESAQV
jgi:hypothetical protein